jgi:putative ABC transport system substrate-binding protein
VNRRDFLLACGGGTLAVLPGDSAQAQSERRVRIAILMNFAAGQPEGQARVIAFTQTMAQHGWIAGQNARFDFYWTDGEADSTIKNAAAMVAKGPNLILASGGSAARAARRATSTIPIVFAQVTDPAGQGLVASLAAPGGNATGFTQSEFSLSGKWLDLLREFSPTASKVAVVRSSFNPAAVSQFAVIQALAPTKGMEVFPASPSDEEEVDRVLATVAREKSGGMIVVTGLSEINRHQAQIIALAAKHRLPAIYPYRFMAEAGGLASYGADTIEPYRKAAEYAHRILNGERPGSLPVQAADKFELVINLKAALAMGITAPPSLLARADEVIE